MAGWMELFKRQKLQMSRMHVFVQTEGTERGKMREKTYPNCPKNPTSEWGKAQKKSVVIEFREPIGNVEVVHTLNGDVQAKRGKDLVARGVDGELYPIDKTIFAKTYDVLHYQQVKIVYVKVKDPIIWRRPDMEFFETDKESFALETSRYAGLLIHEDDEIIVLGEITVAEDNPKTADIYTFPNYRGIAIIAKCCIVERQDFPVKSEA